MNNNINTYNIFFEVSSRYFYMSQLFSLTLKQVFGLGKAKSKVFCQFLGCSPFILTELLNFNHRRKIRLYFNSRYSNYEVLLKRRLLNIKMTKIAIKCYTGVRALIGLPSRGQRTKTNSRTSRRLKNSSNLIVEDDNTGASLVLSTNASRQGRKQHV